MGTEKSWVPPVVLVAPQLHLDHWTSMVADLSDDTSGIGFLSERALAGDEMKDSAFSLEACMG